MSRQDAIGVGNGIRTMETQRTEKQRRMRPDAPPTPQTQDYFLLMTLQTLSKAKRFAYGRTPRCFPSLPGAESPQQMNNVLLDHFFLPMEMFSPPPRLRPHKKAPPLTKEDILTALSKYSPTSAPGPDGIPYSTWKQVNRINSTVLLHILFRLVSL